MNQSLKVVKMKPFHLLILFISLSALMSCEKGDSKKTGPEGWFLAANRLGYKIGTDDQNWHSGQKSGYIESVSDTTTGFGTLMQMCSEKQFKGQRIKMTAYLQSSAEDTAIIAMWVRVDDLEKRVTGDFDNMSDRPLYGVNFWRKCEIVFDVPDASCIINYGLLLGGYGKAWIDNITFETVSNTTFRTASYLDLPFPSEYQVPNAIPQDPVNLDFEE